MENKFFKKIKVKTLLLLFIILLFIIFIPFFLKLKNGYIIQEQTEHKLIDSALKPLDLIHFPLTFFPNKLPKYELYYSEKDFYLLVADLPKNVGEEELTRHLSARQYIDGTFIANDKKYPVQVSIKGEALANYANHKKSLRIKFQEPFKGQSTWDFVVPQQRRFNSVGASEFIAKKLGILIQTWDYSWIRINNEQMGVYEMVDETDTSFLEHNKLSPDDLVFREEKTPLIISKNFAMSIFESNGIWRIDNNPENPDPAAYSAIENLKRIIQMPQEEFHSKIPTIVDMDVFLKWSATSYLLNDQHQDNRNNARLVYLKEKGQFWILPDHIFVQPITQFIDQLHRHTLNEKILSNPQNFWARNEIIWFLVSDQEFEKSLMTYLNSKISMINAPIYQDSAKAFRYLTFRKTVNSQNEIITSNIHTIRSYFNDYDIRAITTNLSRQNSNLISSTKIMTSSFFRPKIDRIIVQFEKIPKKTDLIVFFDSNKNIQLDDSDEIIARQSSDETSRFQIIEVNSMLVAQSFDTSVYDSIRPIATSNLMVVSNDTNNPKLTDLKISLSNSLTGEKIDSTNEFTNTFEKESGLSSFVTKTAPSKFLIKSGNYEITNDTEIPEGELTIEPGTKFNIAPDTSIVSRSNIIAMGTQDAPIIFTKYDPQKSWGSLVILNAKDKSEFVYTTIEYGSGYRKNGIIATGALAAHFSDIIIEKSHITHSGDDDGLNVKHASARIKNNIFDKNNADHIDLDTVIGDVESNTFDNEGFENENSDGLDTSFSRLIVRNNKFHKSFDKCISAGEESDLTISGNIMDNCKYGIAVKDGAKATISTNIIKNNKIGVGTYLKKELYGYGGTAIITNNVFENNREDTNAQENSRIIRQ